MKKKNVVISVVVAVIITVAVIVGAITMIKHKDTEADGEATYGPTVAATMAATSTPSDAAGVDDASAAGSHGSSGASAAELDKRPDCPSTGVIGILLNCMGGKNGDAPQDQGVQLVNVWAWWCGPCKEELPYLQEYADTHPDVQVVGVQVDEDAAGGAHLLNDLNISLPSYQDPGRAISGSLGLPPVLPISIAVIDGKAVQASPGYFRTAEDIDAFMTGAQAKAGE